MSQPPQSAPLGAVHDPAAEVVEICRDLIRIDTSNYGDDSGPGERKAAEYAAGLLDEVGIAADLHESESGRTSLLARWGGGDGRPPLLLHGHLDVVPAAKEDWQLDPFSGAYVMARGLVGTRGDAPTVASPMYKQIFDLRTGRCLEPIGAEPQHLRVWAVRVEDSIVLVGCPAPTGTLGATEAAAP